MKKTILLFIAPFIFSYGIAAAAEPQQPLKGKITVSGAFALYPLTVKWAEEFKKLNPGVSIDISAGGAGKGITDVLSGMADIAMVSREINPEETKKGAYGFAVTKDAVVPTMSALHPALNDIMKKGMKRDAFVNLWITGQFKTWGQAAGIKSTAPVHVFTRSDAAGAAETWAGYLGKKQEDLLGIGVFGDPGLAMAVKKDAVSIGFNNIVYVYDSKTKRQTNGVRIIPIDLNKNGTIDPDENFYDTIELLIDAIVKGKYPSPPARDLYLVTKGKPVDPVVVEFLRFILTTGQQYVHEAGYINLAPEKLSSQILRLK